MKWRRGKSQKKWDNFKSALVLCLTAFLALSLFSHNPRDPSLNSFGLHLKVLNACGYVGAILSDLFFQLFGFCAFLFVPAGLWLSYRLFKPRPLGGESVWTAGAFYFSAFSALCCLLNLYFPKVVFHEGVSLGGALGVVLREALTPLFHTLGTTLILCSVLLLTFVFSDQGAVAGRLLFKGRVLLQRLPGLIRRIKTAPRIFFQMFFKVRGVFRKQIKTFPGIFLKKGSGRGREAEKDPPPPPVLEESEFSPKEVRETGPADFKPEGDEADFLPAETSERRKEGSEAALREKPFAETSGQTFTSGDLPSLKLLSPLPASSKKMSRQEAENLSGKLTDKLRQFSIKGQVTAVKTGPAVTLFEFRPQDNVKVSRIREMANDISLALSSESVRIIAPIPGRDVVGVEASNTHREMVYLKSLLEKPAFFTKSLPLILGRSADGEGVIEDLSRIPHLLIAGTTGSGKSQFVISFITGLLFRHTPESLKMILIDPKQVDLSAFKGVPHLLSPPIVSPAETLSALRWTIEEMEKRYRSLSRFGVRDLNSFNKIAEKLSAGERAEHEEWNQRAADPHRAYYYQKLPLICLIIEEFGDLMADPQFKKSVEMCVVRLAQKARAGGIHLVLAMQSPRKDVVTGLIKTNIPGRISFKVAGGTDSRVILDEGGAERLLSHGDMLFLQPGASKPRRFHGPFIDEGDVSQVVRHWTDRGEAEYAPGLKARDLMSGDFSEGFSDPEGEDDPMYEEILRYVRNCSSISASFLQRKFRIGYPRAARLIEILYEKGVIGPPQGSRPREVLDKLQSPP